MKYLRFAFAQILPIACLLSLWYVLSEHFALKFSIGSPSEVISILLRDSTDLSLPIHLVITLAEAVAGFALGSFFGTITGFLMWYSPTTARIARPYLFILGIVPIFAFAPLVIVWFGIGIGMKVALAALGSFLISLDHAYEGARAVQGAPMNLLKVLNATRFQTLRKVVFPASLSSVASSLKRNVGVALLGAFLGECISADEGLGYYMMRAGSLYDTSAVIAGAVYLLLAASLMQLCVFIGHKLFACFTLKV